MGRVESVKTGCIKLEMYDGALPLRERWTSRQIFYCTVPKISTEGCNFIFPLNSVWDGQGMLDIDRSVFWSGSPTKCSIWRRLWWWSVDCVVWHVKLFYRIVSYRIFLPSDNSFTKTIVFLCTDTLIFQWYVDLFCFNCTVGAAFFFSSCLFYGVLRVRSYIK